MSRHSPAPAPGWRVARVRNAGFTLIETLIALVLLSVMFAILFSGLRMGASSWDAAQNRVEESTEWAIAARFLQRQLAYARQVDRFDPPEGEPALAFRGQSDHLRFVAPLPAHLGGGGLHWIELRQDPGAGLRFDHGLFHPDTSDPGGPRDPETRVLLVDVERLRVRYYGRPAESEGYTWSDTWSEDELPHLVALILTRHDGREITLAARTGEQPAGSREPLFPWEVR